jgi:hypothetical protein
LPPTAGLRFVINVPRQQIFFRLPGDLLEAVRDCAYEEDTSITRQVESALIEWVQLSSELTDPRHRLDAVDRQLEDFGSRLQKLERVAERQGAV